MCRCPHCERDSPRYWLRHLPDDNNDDDENLEDDIDAEDGITRGEHWHYKHQCLTRPHGRIDSSRLHPFAELYVLLAEMFALLAEALATRPSAPQGDCDLAPGPLLMPAGVRLLAPFPPPPPASLRPGRLGVPQPTRRDGQTITPDRQPYTEHTHTPYL